MSSLLQQERRKERIDDQNREDHEHHSLRRLEPDSFRSTAGAKTHVDGDDRDDKAEHHGLGEAVEKVKFLADRKGIQIITETMVEGACIQEVDKGRIGQVLENLLSK